MDDSVGSMNLEESDPNFMEYALKRSLISRNKLAIILKGSNGENQYCCVECPARYTEKEKLELHLCMHNKEYRYLCGICGTGLKRKEHLDRHLMEHQQVRPHVCPTCGKAFKRKEHLNIHQTIHKDDKAHFCMLCNRSFNRKDHLQKHLQTHSKMFLEQNMHPLDEHELMQIKAEVMDEDVKPDISGDDMDSYNEVPFDSSDCNSSQGSFIEPLEVRVTTDPCTERPFTCEICFKSYKRKDHLKIHSWTHMKKDKVCSDCGKGFHKESQLDAHVRVCIQVHLKQARGDHSEEGMDGEDYNSMADQDLLVVRRTNAEQELRPHECVVCHRRFKRKQHLKAHASVHLKQVAHSVWCSLCTQGFQTNDEFERHDCLSANDNPSEANGDDMGHVGDAPQDAKKENNKPADISSLMEQKMEDCSPALDGPSYATVVDERALPVPARVYVCRYCGKPFKRKDHYKIHLHIHTGVRSFFCEHCGKGFYRKDHLQKHAQIHSRIKAAPPAPPPAPPAPPPAPAPARARKPPPALLPLASLPKNVKPEITIHAPSNTKLRVPLQIKVPYQMVLSSDDGEQRCVTIDPQQGKHDVFT